MTTITASGARRAPSYSSLLLSVKLLSSVKVYIEGAFIVIFRITIRRLPLDISEINLSKGKIL